MPGLVGLGTCVVDGDESVTRRRDGHRGGGDYHHTAKSLIMDYFSTIKFPA